MKTRKFITGVLMFTMIFLLSGCTKGKITLKADNFIVELGEDMSEDISAYVTGKQSMLAQCVLDIEDVDVHMIGSYTGKVTYEQVEYPFTVQVEDTIAPKTELLQTVFNLEEGDYLDISDIFEDIEDEDEVIVTFKYDDITLVDEGLMFDVIGEFTIVAEISDPSGNVSPFEFQVNVVELSVPIFEGLTDMIIKAGETPDYLTGVTAVDAKDGDLTNKIEVDDSEVDLKENGEYVVYYSAVDSDDNVGEDVRMVTVIGNPDPVEEEEPEETEPEETEPEEPEETQDATIPEIHGARGMTISLKSKLPNFLEGVTAYDAKDGDLTAFIEVDYSEVDVNEAGEYEVYYSVYDKDDNEGTTFIIVTVVK